MTQMLTAANLLRRVNTLAHMQTMIVIALLLEAPNPLTDEWDTALYHALNALQGWYRTSQDLLQGTVSEAERLGRTQTRELLHTLDTINADLTRHYPHLAAQSEEVRRSMFSHALPHWDVVRQVCQRHQLGLNEFPETTLSTMQEIYEVFVRELGNGGRP